MSEGRTRAGWTDADRDLLRTMWARGESSRDIAAAVSVDVTRNAVMGMVNRLGLMGLGHPDAARLAAIGKVSAVMDDEFSFGKPLHREALLALLVGRAGRDPDDLSLAAGVAYGDCRRFLERLPLVWPATVKRMPARWQGSLEGVFAFILDMAFVAGLITERAERPAGAVNDAVVEPIAA